MYIVEGSDDCVQNPKSVGCRTLSIVRCSKNYKTTFRKLNLFPFSGERRETSTLLGRIESVNLNHLSSDKAQNPSDSKCNMYEQCTWEEYC
jgi:hypothetical protein